MTKFRDRAHAAVLLAERVRGFERRKDPLILALPRVVDWHQGTKELRTVFWIAQGLRAGRVGERDPSRNCRIHPIRIMLSTGASSPNGRDSRG